MHLTVFSTKICECANAAGAVVRAKMQARLNYSSSSSSGTNNSASSVYFCPFTLTVAFMLSGAMPFSAQLSARTTSRLSGSFHQLSVPRSQCADAYPAFAPIMGIFIERFCPIPPFPFLRNTPFHLSLGGSATAILTLDGGKASALTIIMSVAAFGENAGLGTGKFKARREILRLGNEIAYVDEN